MLDLACGSAAYTSEPQVCFPLIMYIIVAYTSEPQNSFVVAVLGLLTEVLVTKRCDDVQGGGALWYTSSKTLA